MATTPVNTAANADLVRKNLMMAVKQYNDSVPRPLWQDMCGVVKTTDQLYEIAALASGLGMPAVTAELAPAPMDAMNQPYRKQYTPQKRTLQFQMSDEAFINDQSGIIKSYGTLLAASFAQAKEIAGAIYMNGASSSTLISTPQGQALSSTAHPLEIGTDSSTFTTAQALSIGALEDAVNNLSLQKAFRYQMQKPVFGGFQLEVHPSNALLAQRLIGADKLPGTNNNDPNPAGRLVTRVISNPYFTNAGYWAIRSMNDMEQKRFCLTRYGFKVSNLRYDDNIDAWVCLGKESYLFDVLDYRGVWYSLAS